MRILLVVVFSIAACLTPEHEWGYVVAFVAFLLAGLSDWLDGYLARKLGQVTTFGKLIDPLADKIVVASACVYLTAIGWCPIWVTIVIIMREFLVTGLRQIAQDQGIIIQADWTGKWKTIFQLSFCTGCLLALTNHSWDAASPQWVQTLSNWCDKGSELPILYHFTLWGAVILTIYSGLSYCVGARKLIYGNKPQ